MQLCSNLPGLLPVHPVKTGIHFLMNVPLQHSETKCYSLTDKQLNPFWIYAQSCLTWVSPLFENHVSKNVQKTRTKIYRKK